LSLYRQRKLWNTSQSWTFIWAPTSRSSRKRNLW